MEQIISAGIVDRYFAKLRSNLSLDVAVVGAGPSGLVAAARLAKAGKKTAVFEAKLAPGGGVWGGGMLMNEVVVPQDALPLLAECGVRASPLDDGYHAVDSVELAAGLILAAVRAGAIVFNAVKVEDVVVHAKRICGVVVNWTPVVRLGMHVDPLVVTARVVLDGTGHPSEIARLTAEKAGFKLETETGGVRGERPLWMESGERTTVAHTGRIFAGLYASGMAANNVHGGFRMGPIFGGMLKSGAKVADAILEELGG